MTNDSAPDIEAFVVWPLLKISYVLAMNCSRRPLALFLLVDCAPGIAEVHFCILPRAWGQSEDIGKEFLEWVWRETSIYRLVGLVPDYNRLALKLARAVGFEGSGSAGSVIKGGKEYELIRLTIEREEGENAKFAAA